MNAVAPVVRTMPAAAAAPPAASRPPRLPALQILRFAAAFLIVLFAVGEGLAGEGLAGDGRRGANPFRAAAIGIDIFFVLSGFIIAYSATPERGSAHFLLRRIARVAPLYWLLTTGLVGLALVAPALLNSTALNAETLIRSYLFVPYRREDGLVQPLLFLGWTLCYEMAFYGVFGLCLGAGRSAVWLACAVLALAVLAGRIWPEGSALWRFYTNPILIEFVFGLLLWRFHARRPIPARAGVLPAVTLALCALLLYAVEPDVPHVVVHGAVATLVVAACLRLPPLRGRLAALLVLLGDASYALYLSHPYILQVPVRILSPHLGAVGLALASAAAVGLAVTVALVLHRFVERPAQAFVLRWAEPVSRA